MESTQIQSNLDGSAQTFYRYVLQTLTDAQVPFMLGGAYAFARYTGIYRDTKDLDLFARPQDCARIFDVFKTAGSCQTELTASHWLGKIYCSDHCVDIIFNSANGHGEVDDEWLQYAVEETVLGIPVLLCPPEETICSKAFVMARDRYDGADVVHLLHACSDTLDWQRLLRRFGQYWRVLYSHLILFGFIYPGERSRIPTWIMDELAQRLQQEVHNPEPSEKLCQGTLLSALQYSTDVDEWGYQDGRLLPNGNLSASEIDHWTDHLKEEEDTADTAN